MPIINDKQFNEAYNTPEKLEQFITESKGHGVLIGKKTYMESNNNLVPMSLIEARINEYAKQVDYSNGAKVDKAVSILNLTIQSETNTKKLEPTFFKSIVKVINKIQKFFESGESKIIRIQTKNYEKLSGTARTKNLSRLLELGKLSQFVAINKLSQKILVDIKPNTSAAEIKKVHEELEKDLKNLSSLKAGIIKNGLVDKVNINVENSNMEGVKTISDLGQTRMNILMALQSINPQVASNITLATPTKEIADLGVALADLADLKIIIDKNGLNDKFNLSHSPKASSKEIQDIYNQGKDRLSRLDALGKLVITNNLDKNILANISAKTPTTEINDLSKQLLNLVKLKAYINKQGLQDKIDINFNPKASANFISSKIEEGAKKLNALIRLRQFMDDNLIDDEPVLSKITVRTTVDEINKKHEDLNAGVKGNIVKISGEKILTNIDVFNTNIDVFNRVFSSKDKKLFDNAGTLPPENLTKLEAHIKGKFDFKMMPKIDLDRGDLSVDDLKRADFDPSEYKFTTALTPEHKYYIEAKRKKSVKGELEETFQRLITGETLPTGNTKEAKLRLSNLNLLESHLKDKFEFYETIPKVNIKESDFTIQDFKYKSFDPTEYKYSIKNDSKGSYIEAKRKGPKSDKVNAQQVEADLSIEEESDEDWSVEEGRELKGVIAEDSEIRSKLLTEIHSIIDSRFEKGILHTHQRGELPFFELNAGQLENLKNSLVRLDELCKEVEGTFGHYKVNLHHANREQILTNFSRNIGFIVEKEDASHVKIHFNE